MKRFGTMIGGLAMGVALLAPMATSCYDDSKLWNEIDMINSTLADLQNSLNGQIQAFEDLIKGGNITISECKKQTDGTYVITLSNGTKFSVLPQGKSLEGFITYKELSGVKYWATYDGKGELVLLQDGDGEYIPVKAATPYIENRNGHYYLVVGDQEYKTGFDFDAHSVITGYEMNKDESGHLYSVSFTFGNEGLTFTVPVDGYKGFTFRLGNDVLKDLYVEYGMTYRISTGRDGVVDYVMQIPDGWRVKESVEVVDSTETLYLDITAPAKELVTSGAAVSSADLKVVAVVEGGSAMVAKLELTTEPFKTFTATIDNVVIENRNGVDKYLYGVSLASEYDIDEIFIKAPDIIKRNDSSEIATDDINAEMSDILGTDAVAGEEYVLWAIPLFYRNDDTAEYYVKENLYKEYRFAKVLVTFDLDTVMFNNAVINCAVKGTSSYYAGTNEKSETLIEDILYKINNKTIEPVTEPLSYEGSAFSFPNAEANAAVEPISLTSYVTWVVPCSPSKTTYTEDDLISVEYTLTDVTGGGDIEVQFTELPVEDPRTSMSVEIASAGATRIYYTYMIAKTANRHNESTIIKELLNKGTMVAGDKAIANIDKLDPDPQTEMRLFAMATDSLGRYGKVQVDTLFTEALEYSDALSVTLSPVKVGQTVAQVAVNVESKGGEPVDYVYWVGRSIDEFWIRMEKKVANVGEYLALYPDEFEKMKYNYPIEDGVLKLSGLRGETDYNIVLLALDEHGKYSKAYSTSAVKAGCLSIKTLAADLGTIVREGSDEWNAAKSQVEITWHKETFTKPENSNMSAFYSFDIKCPTHLTAYILCMTESYFDENPETQTVEHRIIDIETQCIRKYDQGKTIYDPSGNSYDEPDWYDDAGTLHKGTLLNVYDFYVHGFPTNGFATYFAADAHGKEGGCTSWDNGECSNYSYALQHIQKRHSIDYFIDYVKLNRGTYCKNEEVIRKCAEDLMNAYYPHYKDAQPLIYVNDGSALLMQQHYGAGLDQDGNVLDDVFVVFKDAAGNYYEPMKFDVPNYFR